MKTLCRASIGIPIVALAGLAALPAKALAEITVSASVQPAATTVGEPVQLSVTVNGSQQVGEIPSVAVEGALVQHIGASTQFSVVNGSFSSAITHRYLLTPQRLGEMLIPSVQVTVGGKAYQTQPLKVQVGNNGQNASGEPEQPVPLAEIEWPKRTVYVGETFPVEAHLLVPGGLRWNINRMPDFETDAFTKIPFQQPQTRQFVKDGAEYQLINFRTVMTAIKSGKVPLGPLTFTIQVAVPKKRNNNAASPFGGIFDGFPFDTQPTTLQEKKVILPEQQVEIRELPVDSKPASFRGAIGKFRFSSSTRQTTVKAGEPLNVTLQVEGEGNFDRIEAPPMVKADGWRVYPPEASFTKSDDLGLRGVKTFNLAVVPEKKHQETPVFEFVAFDPEKGEYLTLRSSASELKVEGIKEPEAPPKPAEEAAPKAKPKAPEGAEQASPLQEILAPVPVRAAFWSSPTAFWSMQAALALAIGGAAAAVVLRRIRAKHGPAREAMRRMASLQRAFHAATLRGECLALAVRIVQSRTSFLNGQPEGAVDADAATAVLGKDEKLCSELAWLFDADAANQFAGNQRADVIKPDERLRIEALLERVQ